MGQDVQKGRYLTLPAQARQDALFSHAGPSERDAEAYPCGTLKP